MTKHLYNTKTQNIQKALAMKRPQGKALKKRALRFFTV